jgi:hypothetical protein
MGRFSIGGEHMQSLIDLFSNPLVWKLLGGYWVFSAFVGAIPSPDKAAVYIKSGLALFIYGIIFGFLHGVSGNIARAAVAFKVPGAENPETPKV